MNTIVFDITAFNTSWGKNFQRDREISASYFTGNSGATMRYGMRVHLRELALRRRENWGPAQPVQGDRKNMRQRGCRARRKKKKNGLLL